MDAPPIQYAKTADGVNIAFWAIGDGPPLVFGAGPAMSNIQIDWEWDQRRLAYERLAERATVVRYDPRGLGLSQRDCFDASPEASVRDLEAVGASLRLDRFALYGGVAPRSAFVFAAEHPERVSHLILTVHPLERLYSGRSAAIRVHAEQDWEMFTEIFARVSVGWDNPSAVQLAAFIRGSHDVPTNFLDGLDAVEAFSPAPYLAAIKAPTLILHPRDREGASRIARSWADGIRGAHLVAIPWPIGTSLNETVVKAVLDFINTTPAAPGAPIAAPKVDISAVRTILWTDLVAHTQMMQRLGDERGRDVLREHERLTREALGAHGGSEVKAMGDGFMAWFPSATGAVECAIALQKAFAERNAAEPEPISVRIGINAGEPIAEGDDLFGASIIATARITAQATGGQILASDVVRLLLAGKGFTFADKGEHPLKGFDEPVRLHEVRWEE